MLIAALLAGATAAQAPCAQPEVTTFSLPPETARVGRRQEYGFTARETSRLEIDWGDGLHEELEIPAGERTARRGHRYTRSGPTTITAHAEASCGARSEPARVAHLVAPRCAQAADASLFYSDCDRVRGRLVLSAQGLRTRGTWINPPCRDVILPPRTEPAAHAAACLPPAFPVPVAGRLPVRPGGTVLLQLSAPASRLSAALGTARAKTQPSRSAQRVGRSGRMWRLRLPRSLGGATRVHVRAHRARGSVDAWVAGVRSV